MPPLWHKNSRELHAQSPEITAPRKIAQEDAHQRPMPLERVDASKSIKFTWRPTNAQRKMSRLKCSDQLDAPVKQLVSWLTKRIHAKMDTKDWKMMNGVATRQVKCELVAAVRVLHVFRWCWCFVFIFDKPFCVTKKQNRHRNQLLSFH